MWVQAFAVLAMLLGSDPATLPSTRPVAVRLPASETNSQKFKTIRRLVLKPDAPPAVKAWFLSLPRLKENELRKRQNQIDNTQRDIDAAKAEIQSLIKAPVPTIDGGTDNMGSPIRRRDEKAIRARMDQIQNLRRRIPELIKQKRSQEQARREVEEDQAFFTIPQWDPQQPLRLGILLDVNVKQLVEDGTALVSVKGQDFWLHGVDTAGWSDDTIQNVSKPVVSVQTQAYTTIMGARRTLAVIEPVSVIEHIEVITEQVPIP